MARRILHCDAFEATTLPTRQPGNENVATGGLFVRGDRLGVCFYLGFTIHSASTWRQTLHIQRCQSEGMVWSRCYPVDVLSRLDLMRPEPCGRGGPRGGLRGEGILAPELGVDGVEVVRARPGVLKRATGFIGCSVVVLLVNLLTQPKGVSHRRGLRTVHTFNASKNSSHGTLFMLARRLRWSILVLISVVSPLTQWLAAHPPPNANIAIRFPAGARVDHSDARPPHALHRRLDVLLIAVLRESDERLLQCLVRQRLRGCECQERLGLVCGDSGVLRCGWVREEVIVHLV